MKKVVTIVGGVMLNIVLCAISVSFYPEDSTGAKIVEGTNDVPFIMFIIGCYLFPWYFLNKHKFSKGLHILATGLFSWSFLFIWSLLGLTNADSSTFIFWFSLIGSVIAPILAFKIMRFKETKLQEVAEEREVEATIKEEEKQEAVQSISSLEALTSLIESIEDPEVHEKGQEILSLLKTILKDEHTLDIEEKHVLNRLVQSDLVQLIQTYLLLNEEKQNEIEEDVLHNLDIIARYLHSIIDGVSNEHLKEMQTSMHLIEKRYNK